MPGSPRTGGEKNRFAGAEYLTKLGPKVHLPVFSICDQPRCGRVWNHALRFTGHAGLGFRSGFRKIKIGLPSQLPAAGFLPDSFEGLRCEVQVQFVALILGLRI